MADLTQSLLKAISIIADKTVEEISADKTIKAIVKKNISTSEGKYLVTYNNGDFYAYLQSGSTEIYQPGEQVYILVPADDMGQKKFIIGKVQEEDNYASSDMLESTLLNDYIMLGNNAVVDDGYGTLVVDKRMQPLPLNSHAVNDYYYCYLKNQDELNDLVSDYDNNTYPTVRIDEESFVNSAKQAEALLIRAKFKANIDTKNIGHYGIIVNIAFEDKTNPQIDINGEVIYPPKLIAYTLDTGKMTGNPMKFYDYTSQYMIAQFDGQNYLYIDSIVAFSEGFVSQETASHSEEDDPYIWIDGLEIVALDSAIVEVDNYKLKLTTPNGNTIKEGKKDNLKIDALLTYMGKEVTKNAVFYWGVKDPSITSIDDNYHAKLGAGYRYIQDINGKELILAPSNLTAIENTYVCVCVYESNIILKGFVTLYNNNNKLNITIESDQGTEFQFNEGNPTLTCLINKKTSDYQDNFPDSAFSFVWSKEDEENGSVLLDKTTTWLESERSRELQECELNNQTHTSSAGRTPIQVLSYYSTRIAQVKNVSYPNGVHGSKITCALKNINTSVTYSCSVYRGGVYVGYSSITLINSKKVINNNYYVTIKNGSQVFQYDESGVAPNSIKQKEPVEVLDLEVIFHSPQGAEVTPKKVRWAVPLEKTLINIPSIGLELDSETGERYFTGNIYPLSIKENYDYSCNNNQIVAIVTHADGTEYRQSTNLLFTKIGEIGTNGTDTVVKIDECLNVPNDECLTIIKSAGVDANIHYNTGDNVTNPVLKASLYTNNTEVLGHTTKWTIAGTSEEQAKNYKVETENNLCKIDYEEHLDKLDTRIVKAQTSLGGKYLSSFYGIPAIEYLSENYTEEEYPIKILKDKTLKSILYSSGGTNPSYDESQGVHVKLDGWEETGYLEWEAQGGADGATPNLSLSETPKSKTGSKKLEINGDNSNIQTTVLELQDIGQLCLESTSGLIKDYIKEFLTDIEQIGIDNILSTRTKLEALWNRLNVFLADTSDKGNIYIRTIYEKYTDFFNQMEQEYSACKDVNEKSTDLYNKIQAIWKSEWPSVITEDRLYTTLNSGITTIEQLNSLYRNAYDDRSNSGAENAIILPARAELYESSFINLLSQNDNHLTSIGEDISQVQSILIEYANVLVAYLRVLVNETQDCFINNDSLHNQIKSKYSLANADWNDTNNSGNKPHSIGVNIYELVSSAEDNIANVYDNARELYKYYQTLYTTVSKYQIAEESNTLNVWYSILNGQDPNLLDQIYIIPNETFNGLYMNNNVVGTAYILNDGNRIEIAKIYVPIIMTLNTYELAALNGWDGTNVDIGDDHIMTPQIGAGIKDDTTNTFTGMVMGVVGNTAANPLKKIQKNNKVGLIGYSNGKQSVFIDSETGKASFGLPEDDTDTSEGRIELVPGGVSKIGNWKIGNRFLYNIIDGSYERRKDIDNNEYKLMVPHDKHGIILSSDQPYIHVKGEVYEDANLVNIDYTDEYNNINPGDSLELRMDPGNKSLFSIVQHTSGFGDEDTEDLLFGYRASGSDTIPVIKDYIPNQNIDEEIQVGNYDNGTSAEYYIYRLATDGSGNYIPYYKEEDNSNVSKINANSWISQDTIISGSALLNAALPWANFRRTSSDNPVFSIDNNTGVISYNPENLVWTNNEEGYWQSVTEKTSSEEDLTVTLKYLKDIDAPFEKNILFGKIRNNTGNKLYKIKIKDCSLSKELTNISFNDSINAYIQFYLVSNNNDDLNEALLISEEINILNNEDLDIELYSFNEEGLVDDGEYWLKAYLYINSYTIDADCSCTITKSAAIYKAPPIAPFGVLKITTTTGANVWRGFSTSGGSISKVSGQYRLYNNNSFLRLELKVNGTQRDNNTNAIISGTESLTYDFIVWQQGDETAIAGGCSFTDKSTKICTLTPTEFDNLNGYIDLDIVLSENNPLYVSFYLSDTYVKEEILYNVDFSSGSNSQNSLRTEQKGHSQTITRLSTGIRVQGTETLIQENDADTVTNTLEEETIEIVQYKLIDEITTIMQDRSLYNIDWNNSTWADENSFNNISFSWNFLYNNFIFGNIYGFVPNDNSFNRLCIQSDLSLMALQGIPYSKTYWYKPQESNSSIQKVAFYKDYYIWINLNNKRTQYGYIDIDENKNIYYKYIKTLTKKTVNNWFENINLPIENRSNTYTIVDDNTQVWDKIEFTVNSNIFKEALYWKEFVRVGLDENGRLFSAGLQDKKTYSRTGKIYAFGKVPNLYGQEVRVQSAGNKYGSAIKIFTQNTNSSTLKTTYITQGQNDNGSISIRTAGNNNFVELAASQFSNNENNLIPEKETFINVSYNNGIILQTNSGKIDFNNKLFIEADAFSFQSRAKENDNKTSKFKYSINQNVDTNQAEVFVQTTSYVLSSNLTASSTSGNNAGHYKIKATNINDIPEIQLQVGSNNIGINISPNEIVLKTNDISRLLKIDNINGNGCFVIDGAKIELNENLISLNNGHKNSIKIWSESVEDDDGRINYLNYISLFPVENKGLKISKDNVVINNNFEVEGSSSFKQKVSMNENFNALKNVFIGDPRNTQASNVSTIRIYDTFADNKERYVWIKASDLKSLFDWFNSCRWGMGYANNTLYIRNVKNNNTPEGSYSSNKYNWTFKTFAGSYSNGY